MTHWVKGMVALVLGLALAGCQGEDSSLEPVPAPPEAHTVAERLAAGAALEIDVERSEVSVNGRTLPPIAGHARVAAAGGALRIETLEVTMGAIDIPPEALPPSGLALRDVAVVLVGARAARATWSADGATGVVTIPVDLELRWSFVSQSGAVVPLTPQRIEGVPLELDVSMDAAGRISASLAGRRDGTFFDWLGGRVTLEDLRFALAAHTL